MITLEEIRNYCLEKPFVEEGFPFDNKTLVFKVCGKMFALVDVEEPEGMNLKCDPEESIELRERYYGIQPGYHMNKKHWNTVSLNEDVSRDLFYKLIDQSYTLVYNSLPKRVRDGLSL
jgi:predicted DNA-binding protein (MmcQ/YjbR family)